MFGADLGSQDWGGIVDGVLTVSLSLAGVLAIGRFIMFFQERVVATTVVRNSVLETRVDELERKLDAEQDGHRECKQELHEHKIEAAQAIGVMQGQIAVLTAQLNRPRRASDPPVDA